MGDVHVEAGGIGEVSLPSSQLCYEPDFHSVITLTQLLFSLLRLMKCLMTADTEESSPTPHDNLQEIPLGKSDFSWFTDGSYLNNENAEYCSG